MPKYTKLNKSEAALPKKEPKSSSRRMLYTVLALISIFILFATFNHKAASDASNLAEQAVTNQEKVISYIILLEPTLSDAEKKEKINTFCKQYGGVVKNEFKFISGYEIEIPGKYSIDSLQSFDGITSVEVNDEVHSSKNKIGD